MKDKYTRLEKAILYAELEIEKIDETLSQLHDVVVHLKYIAKEIKEDRYNTFNLVERDFDIPKIKGVKITQMRSKK